MRIKLLLASSILLATLASLLLTFCASDTPNTTSIIQNTPPTSPLPSIKNRLWAERTLALLDKTHLWSGSYTGRFTQATGSYDPYTTYYAILTYKDLGAQVPNKNRTINALKASQRLDGHFTCESQSGNQNNLQINQVGCIYYIVSSLQALNSSPNDVQAIIRNLNELQSNSGIYASDSSLLQSLNTGSPGSTPNLVATREALAIFKMLGATPQQRTTLQSWLLSQWEHGTSNRMNKNSRVSFLASIAESLNLLGISVHDLPHASSYLSLTENTCHSALDLKQGSQKVDPLLQTNLFLITDCLSLEQLLMGSTPDSAQRTDLVPLNFFTQLALFQQTSGGFNAFFMAQQGQPDIQGTYQAVRLFKENGQRVPRPIDIVALLNRQSRGQGGFLPVFFTPRTSAPDTYLSLQVRTLLSAETMSPEDQKSTRESVSRLLQNTAALHSITTEELFYSFLLARQFDLNTTALIPMIEQRSKALLDSLQDGQPLTIKQLRDAYYLSQDIHFNGSAVDKLTHALLITHTQDGSFQVAGSSRLEYTWEILSILKIVAPESLSKDLRQRTTLWINQHQAADGGFTEPGTTNVYSCYWAIESLRALSDKRSPSTLGTWLKGLEDADGGIRAEANTQNGSTLIATYDTLIMAQQLNIVL